MFKESNNVTQNLQLLRELISLQTSMDLFYNYVIEGLEEDLHDEKVKNF